MTDFLRVFKHLLPRARAWHITVDKKLRRFFAGLSGVGEDVKTFFDGVWLDIFPETTRQLGQWEGQFGLRNSGLTEAERRDRLAAAWKSLYGQDPEYIQATLRSNGFDVYVHEWWVPGSEAAPGVKQCATPRNPLLYLRRGYAQLQIMVECGEGEASCGEPFAECGNSRDLKGYPLVNKVFMTSPDLISLCGEEVAACGEPEASCGYYTGFVDVLKDYIVPIDSTKWSYFLYIGGQTFGTLAQIEPTRKDEFEDLCLKICPTHQWLGILVDYT